MMFIWQQGCVHNVILSVLTWLNSLSVVLAVAVADQVNNAVAVPNLIIVPARQGHFWVNMIVFEAFTILLM